MDKAQIRLKRQRRQELAPRIVRALYRKINGFEISTSYRQQQSYANKEVSRSLTYGEIEPKSFLQILLWIEANDPDSKKFSKKKFVDLGCGLGRACICAAISVGQMFDAVVGIDIVPGLIEKAISARDTFFKVISTPIEILETPVKLVHKSEIGSKDISGQLVSYIESELQNSDVTQLKVESLANSVCKKFGHKSFKEAIKRFKSFTNFLKNHSEFILSDDRLNVSSASSTDPVSSSSADSITISESVPEDSMSVPGLEDSGEQELRNLFSKQKDNVSSLLPVATIEYFANDIFETEWWTDAYVVYVASLLFTDIMMEKLAEQALNLVDGSWLVTLKPLPVTHLSQSSGRKPILKHESFFDMSWEMAMVFIYRIQ